MQDHSLQKRRIVDLGLLNAVLVEVTRMRQEMLENQGPLTPSRRTAVFQALEALQGGPELC